MTFIMDKLHYQMKKFYHLISCGLFTRDNSVLSLLLFSGIMIESSSVLLVDPEDVRENTIDQSVIVDITLTLAQNSADFELEENLWQSVRIYTADANGNQRGNANSVALLSTEQSRTRKCVKVGCNLTTA